MSGAAGYDDADEFVQGEMVWPEDPPSPVRGGGGPVDGGAGGPSEPTEEEYSQQCLKNDKKILMLLAKAKKGDMNDTDRQELENARNLRHTQKYQTAMLHFVRRRCWREEN